MQERKERKVRLIMDERVNVKALFLGLKSENYSYFKEMLG